MGVSWLTEFRVAVAAATAAESGGLLTFRAAGGYVQPEVGLYGVVLPAAPDEAVGMTAYVLTDDIETVVGVQFRLRAKTEARLDLFEDALSSSWTLRPAGTLSGATLIRSAWASGASLGQDSNGRLSRSANFYLTAHRALVNRT